MKMNHLYVLLAVAAGCLFAGCSYQSAADPFDREWIAGDSAFAPSPRLFVSGKVMNSEKQPLGGIYVSVYGVRKENEPDIPTYNYARTDDSGNYTIIRYRGRETPAEITVVATDSTGLYQEQTVFVPVLYDSVTVETEKILQNGYATAEFVLSREKSQP